MIRIVSGLPGAMKTGYCAFKVIEALQTSSRPIVTNMALRLDPWVDGKGKARKGLCRYLEDIYGTDFDARDRIVFLEDSEVYTFWRVRPRVEFGERPVKLFMDEPIDERFHIDKSKFSGAIFFIDEIHEYADSRDTMKRSKEMKSWGTQHRRAEDEAWLITQSAELIDKRLRILSQECHYLTNHSLRQMLFWRQPDVITVRITASTPPQRSETPLYYNKVGFKREDMYEVYDTGAGIGVAGKSKADIGVKAKGMHWATIPVGIGALILALAFGFNWLRTVGIPALFNMGKSKPAMAAATNAVMGRPMQLVSAAPFVQKPVYSPPPPPPKVNGLYKAVERTNKVVGVMHGTVRTTVVFDDGFIMDAKSVRQFGRDYVIDGILYPRGERQQGTELTDAKSVPKS